MKIQLLVAISDKDYTAHLSRVLTEKNMDLFEVSVCSKPDLLGELLSHRSYDAALLDTEMVERADLSAIRLPLLVWDGTSQLPERAESLHKVRKYQRISSISSEVVQEYAARCQTQEGFNDGKAHMTVVWSPAGGSGKTTVALACAARYVADGRKTLYLDLEPFSATPAFFQEPGKSISHVFERLNGDVSLLIQSIRTEDVGTGISYFGRPQNYDDLNVLTSAELNGLLAGCASVADELVVDLGSSCSPAAVQVLDTADSVLLVADSSAVCASKCEQFRTQHNVYDRISEKLTVVANCGARNVAKESEKLLSLPKVDSTDPAVVYKTLSGYMK